MALKAGYYGIKKKMVNKLTKLTGIYSIGSGLNLSSAGALSVKTATTSQKGIVQLDDVPTEDSTNVVTSGGVYTALSAKQDTLTFDDTPTEDSTNPVKSGGVYDAINDVYVANGVTGAKNLFNGSASNWEGGAGITITKNADYSLSISAGTLTSDFTYPSEATHALAYDLEPSTSYILSYGNTTIENIELQVYIKETSGSSWARLVDDSIVNEISFTTPSSFYSIWARMLIRNTKTVVESTLYPMLRLATDTDDTYQPYAMTNAELTEAVAYHAGSYSINETIFNGYVTSGISELQIFIAGRFDEVTSVSIAPTSVLVRGIAGYVKDENSVDISGSSYSFADNLKISQVTNSDFGIKLVIKNINDGAFSNVDNNTPITVQFGGSGTITLS